MTPQQKFSLDTGLPACHNTLLKLFQSNRKSKKVQLGRKDANDEIIELFLYICKR